MKKIFLILLALSVFLVLAYVFFAVKPENTSIPRNTEKTSISGSCRILALGDSLTAGNMLDVSVAYPNQLEGMLRSNGKDCQVINAGVSGDTSKMLLERLDFTLWEDSYTLAILEIGANDGLQGLPIDAMETNIESMIQALQLKNIPVMLVWMQIPNNAGAYAIAFREVYPRLAKKYKVPFYPFFLDGVALDPRYNLPDGIHPNPAGYTHIATKIFEFIQNTPSISL